MTRFRWLALGLFLLGLPGCNLRLGDRLVELEAKEDAEAEDEECQVLLSEKDEIAEARQWLAPQHRNHVLAKGSKKDTLKLVEDLYSAGATAVHIVEIDRNADREMASSFVVTLPANKEKRKKLIGLYSKFYADAGGEEDYFKDHQQKYLHFWLDL